MLNESLFNNKSKNMNSIQLLKSKKPSNLYSIITWLFILCGGNFYMNYILPTNPQSKNKLIRKLWGGYAYKDPKTRYFYYRGQVFNDLHQTRLAIEDFKKVLQQNQRHIGALLFLVDLYLNAKMPSDAYPLIKKLQLNKLPSKITKAVNFWFPEQ